MNVMVSSPPNGIASKLDSNGYVFMRSYQPYDSTLQVAHSIGAVVDIGIFLPRSGIPTVQKLNPRQIKDSAKNMYSGIYGLDNFPLHTDLAHWYTPPRYLIMRCKIGSNSVTTKLLPSSILSSCIGIENLQRAIARPRRRSRGKSLCALPLMFLKENVPGIRWDPEFLVPINRASEMVAEFMSDELQHEHKLVTIGLVDKGDTLVVDNWRFLHGRSSVPPTDLERCIERVYLSEIYA